MILFLQASSEVRWKTRENVIMRLEDMTDSHLANAIAMVERATKSKKCLPFLYHERDRRKAPLPKLIITDHNGRLFREE